jgi:hypothetical protein
MRQVLTDPTKQQPEDQLTAAAFDPFGQRLVTAGNHLTAWPVVVPDDDEYRKHSSVRRVSFLLFASFRTNLYRFRAMWTGT